MFLAVFSLISIHCAFATWLINPSFSLSRHSVNILAQFTNCLLKLAKLRLQQQPPPYVHTPDNYWNHVLRKPHVNYLNFTSHDSLVMNVLNHLLPFTTLQFHCEKRSTNFSRVFLRKLVRWRLCSFYRFSWLFANVHSFEFR